MAVTQVSHPEHESEFPITHGDRRMLAEHQRLCPLLGLRHLDEHAADQERVDDRSKDGLEQKQNYPLGAFVCNVSVAVAYGGLGLYEEQEGRGKVVHVGHTRSVLVVVRFVEVSSDVGDKPPHGGHEEPSHRVGEDEDEQIPAPFQVYQRGEQVREVPASFTAQVPMLDVATSVLVHKALPLLLFLWGRLIESGPAGGGGHYLIIVPKFLSKCRHTTMTERNTKGFSVLQKEKKKSGSCCSRAQCLLFLKYDVFTPPVRFLLSSFSTHHCCCSL